MDGHTVSPFNLSRTLPVGGGLLVPYSLSGSPVINNSCKWLLWCLARVGGFNQCASPNKPMQLKPVLSKFQQYNSSSHSKPVSAMSATDGIKEVILDFFSFLLSLPLIPSSKMFLWQVVLLGEAH